LRNIRQERYVHRNKINKIKIQAHPNGFEWHEAGQHPDPLKDYNIPNDFLDSARPKYGMGYHLEEPIHVQERKL